ncbi:MAG: hypothetical protein ABI865_08785, partial [Nitrosospira sp.]
MQGKTQRREMVRPRMAEQCLQQEGVTPQRDAGAMKRGRGIPCAARSPLRGAPRATPRGAPFEGVATLPCVPKAVLSAMPDSSKRWRLYSTNIFI